MDAHSVSLARTRRRMTKSSRGVSAAPRIKTGSVVSRSYVVLGASPNAFSIILRSDSVLNGFQMTP